MTKPTTDAAPTDPAALPTPEDTAEPICVRRGMPLAYGAEIVRDARESAADIAGALARDSRERMRKATDDETRHYFAGESAAFARMASILRGGGK